MKKHKQQAATTFSVDSAGNRLAHVALSGTHERTTLLADDLDRLHRAGWSPYWSFAGSNGQHRYVVVYACSTSGRKRATTVARLIAEVGKGEVVAYADGDRRNLRRDNLLVKKGFAWTSLATLQPRKGVIGGDAALFARCAEKFTANFREGIALSLHG